MTPTSSCLSLLSPPQPPTVERLEKVVTAHHHGPLPPIPLHLPSPISPLLSPLSSSPPLLLFIVLCFFVLSPACCLSKVCLPPYFLHLPTPTDLNKQRHTLILANQTHHREHGVFVSLLPILGCDCSAKKHTDTHRLLFPKVH